MGFIDNPVINALGNQLGLGGVFASARATNGSGSLPPGYGDPGIGGVTPGASPNAPVMAQNSPPPKPGRSTPNVPEYKNRPYIPRNESPSSQRTGGTGGGIPSAAPGVMDYETLQSPEVQKLLGQYGVHPTDTPPDPNLFVHNPEAFVKHPVLSGLLEHGLRGLAYMHSGTNFLDSLSGGVRGIQESDAASAQQQNNQMTAPFQQAGLAAQLQHQTDEHNSSIALQQYHEAMAKANGENAETRRMRLAAVPPRKNAVGQMETLQEDPDTPGKFKWAIDPDLGEDEQTANKQKFFEHGTNALAALHGGDPAQITDEERATLQSHWDMAQHAAAVHNADARDRTSIQVGAGHDAARMNSAGRSGAGGGKVNPATKQEILNLNQEEKNIRSQIKGTGMTTFDDKGQLVIKGSDDYPRLVAQKNQRLTQIQQRRDELTKSMNTGPAPTAPSNPNPLTVTPAAPTGNANPFRH
jgi:hypothetical protein